jgi:hypothetical protein
MDKRLLSITFDQVNAPPARQEDQESLDSVWTGIALACLSYMLPVVLLCVVMYTRVDLFLASALTVFVHAEIRYAQGKRRALRKRAELISRLRQLASAKAGGGGRLFAIRVNEASKRFRQLAFVDMFVPAAISICASATVALLAESHARFRLIDILLPFCACAALSFAWLRLADWHLKSLVSIRTAVIAVLLATTPLAAAAMDHTYSAHCFSGIPSCAESINDLVTDRFIARFPSDKWRIVIFSDVHQYSDKSAVAVALAGVAPRTKGQDGRSATQFPVNRFVRTIKSDGAVGPMDMQNLERAVIRDAIEDLMAKCDLLSKCDVYTPQE